MDLSPSQSEKGSSIYRECLRNHAAAMGGTVLDGCREFMASGEEGSEESFRCSACGCHRNFHRKESPGEEKPYRWCNQVKEMKILWQKGVLISGSSRVFHPMVMPLGAAPPQSPEEAAPPPAKKRFRTKFTAEQKDKMVGFAEKIGWRLQREDEREIQDFCLEIGVRRRVLKVWMHNNKAKKNPLPPD